MKPEGDDEFRNVSRYLKVLDTEYKMWSKIYRFKQS